jgi:hypothetical protein
MNRDDIHTADFLKRQARKLQKEKGLLYHVALDQAAQSHHYANWDHFSNTQRTWPTVPRTVDATKQRGIAWVKGVKPLHFSKRVAEYLSVGTEAWISLDGRMALPVIVTEVDHGSYCVRFERPSKRAGISRAYTNGTTATHSFFVDEVRSTPELACLNCVTM